MAVPPVWFPEEPTIVHYTAALFAYRGLQGLINSLVISVSATMLSCLVGTMMAYSLARFATGGQHLSFWVLSQRFLPPVAIILMTAPILLPIVTTAGFDPYWFAVIFTINMEIGLITPPVGLNLYVINGIAPDISLGTILKGALPFMLAMVLGIVILCIFPSIATWLPDLIMGPGL